MSTAMPMSFASSSTQVALHRIGATWQWYVIRGAGFAAAALLILLMVFGIGQVTGLTYRFFEPVKAWMIHKALAIALCVAILVHVSFLLLDHFVSFNLVQITVPFVSHYNNGTKLLGMGLGGLAVSFGILAAYGVVIIVLSSLGWIESKKKTWRWLHYLSYFVMLSVFLHALYVGSDLKYGTFRTIWVFLIFVIALAVVSRLLRAGTLRRKP
jgi:predicted ferric reductase